MGQLVKGGLLRPLDTYEKAYGWDDRYADLLLDLNRFTPDAKDFGDGKLYGISQMGEIVGVFYNRDKVTALPKTFADFERQLAAAKQRGDVPVAFGNLDKWPGIHDFQTVQNAYVAPDDVRDFVFARDGASIDTPENQQAATQLQDWAKRGWFTPDFNGTAYDPAWQQFARGKGTFLIAGTWLVADLEKRMGKRVGFMLAPPREAGGDPVSLGGESLPFAITSKSKHPDVAAAYIDFLTNADAARVLVETGNLPAMPTSAQPDTPLRRDMFAAWRTLTDHEGIVPYLDYTTPDVLRRHHERDPAAAGGQAGAGRVHRRPAGRFHVVCRQALTPPRPARRGASGTCTACRRSPSSSLFVLVPLVHSAWISLFAWDGVTGGEWVGLDNYTALVSDADLRAAFVHALVLLVFYAALPIAIGLLLAALMARTRVRGLAAFRTILFLPQVVALVVVGVMWRMIYAPDGGLLNNALGAVGLGGRTGSGTSTSRCRPSG